MPQDFGVFKRDLMVLPAIATEESMHDVVTSAKDPPDASNNEEPA